MAIKFTSLPLTMIKIDALRRPSLVCASLCSSVDLCNEWFVCESVMGM